MGDSLETIDQSIDTQIVSIVDHKAFCNYLRKAILVLFDDEELNSSKLEEALDDNRANQECIKKFLSDSQVQTLYIQKSSTKGKRYFVQFFEQVSKMEIDESARRRKIDWALDGKIDDIKPDS